MLGKNDSFQQTETIMWLTIVFTIKKRRRQNCVRHVERSKANGKYETVSVEMIAIAGGNVGNKRFTQQNGNEIWLTIVFE